MDAPTIHITLELTADLAAALHRFADKADYQAAQAVLYPHLDPELRAKQAHQIMRATLILQRALEHSGVNGWPWVETGRAESRS